MIYFGIEIYDGKPFKEVLLDEEISLKEQWFVLTQDITCIDYNFRGFEFSLDVGWYPIASVTPDSFFKTDILEGPRTEGGRFFRRYSRDIKQLKIDMQDAADLIQKFKSMTDDEIFAHEIPELSFPDEF